MSWRDTLLSRWQAAPVRQRRQMLAVAAQNEEARYQHPAWWLAKLRAAYPDHWRAIAAAGNDHDQREGESGPPPAQEVVVRVFEDVHG